MTHGDGRPAFDFTLPDQSRTPWRLRDHLDGAVVLVFYRGDW